MAEVSSYFQGDLSNALNAAMAWLIARLNVNVSPFTGNAATTPTNPAFAEGAIDPASGTLDTLAQEAWPNIVLDPVAGAALDGQAGPDGFAINYSYTPLLSGNVLVNVLALSAVQTISGSVFNLTSPASSYRVDVYSRTDVFYFQGSAAIASDNSWSVAAVNPGTVIAFLMPSTSQQPATGSHTSAVTGWVSHSNLRVGARLTDYFVRVYSKTDIEYLQEDNIPIIVQDSTHARFGSSVVPAAGTVTAHLVYNDPVLGAVELYSTLQNLAVYSDLPRSIEVPPGDPDYASPDLMVSSNTAFIQNRCWIYDAALAIIAFSVAGLWDAAQRIVLRLNALRENPGYLPSCILENAQDGSTGRWTLAAGAGTVANVFDSTEPPASSGGSNVILFTATAAPAAWNFSGAGLPDSADSIVQASYQAGVNFTFILGVTSSTGKVTAINLASSGAAGYNAAGLSITAVLAWTAGHWQVIADNINNLVGQYLPGETITSINSFEVQLQAAGTLELDNLSVGAPQPAGSLSFSYDVYNGQVDQAYIRSGAMAWVAYAYAIYMERTGDFENAALALQSMVNCLFSIQSAANDLTRNLVMLGWGSYIDPGYQYVPGQILSVSTEHNVDCYFALTKAASILPTAATNLLNNGLITETQYISLIATATTAGSVAGQISAALLAQLWIPAAGSTPGHFAQGASNAGLDTSLALDASGSWAAMFCHEVGQDSMAVSCLEFVYQTFFLGQQQILESSAPNSYNEAYQQLTKFDGFKPYADSTGGYSGSPASVWMEGTWGVIAALLRLSDNTSLQAYFSANYPGGVNGFITDLIQSMNTVFTTTGEGGLLSFSLASRALPWEFSARMAVAPTAWFWISATRNDVLLTTASSSSFGYPYLKIPQGVQQTIRQLDGQGSVGALEIDAIDVNGYLTALVSGGKLEGRRVALAVGYPGMSTTDFVTVATQEIEAVQTLADTTGYTLQCRDLTRSAKTNIFTVGDDGLPVSKSDLRTVVANPMDVALIVFQNELGFGQTPSTPESSWMLFDPNQWDATGTTNPTLIDPNPYLDLETILFYRNGIFAGLLLDFTFDRPVEAKQFLEYEIFHALGGYMVVLADGSISPRFFLPPSSFLGLFAFNDTNLTALPKIERQPIINQVAYRLDYDGSQFQTELFFLDATSIQQFGLVGEQIIESKGVTTVFGGITLAGLTATRLFRRYAGFDPVTGAPNGGAVILTVTSQFMTLTVEVGDYVFVSHPLLPNFETGRRGVYNRIFEVIEKQPNYQQGSMTYRLLDTGWMSAKTLSQIAPSGTPAFTQATSAEQAQFMFICENSTGTYSNGAAGKTLF